MRGDANADHPFPQRTLVADLHLLTTAREAWSL